MSTTLNLHLDFLETSNFDALRGPGSSSSEQIPTASPDFRSPLPSSFDSHESGLLERTQSAKALGAIKDDNAEEETNYDLHVTVVGGDIGAYATALAFAKSERIHVTLVNIGVGPFTALGNGTAAHASMLTARVLSHLDEAGRWDGMDGRVIQEDEPFGMSGRSSRWKGKGVIGQSVGLGERIRREGARLDGHAIRSYSNGERLTSHEYSISTGEDVSMFAIDTDTFLAILRDTCLSHPRVDVRPRAIVRNVLPGLPSSATRTFDDKATKDRRSRGDKCPSDIKKPDSDNKRPSNAIQSVESGNDRGRRRKARESFIQLDDGDLELPIHPVSSLSPVVSTPLSNHDASLDELLRSLPAQLREDKLFETDGLSGDVTPQPIKLGTTFQEEATRYKSAVVLISGETIEADVIVGTEGPLSKVLDVVQVKSSDADQFQLLREDGVYRTTIPMSKLTRDPELRQYFIGRQGGSIMVTWPGPGRYLITYPINNDSLHVSLTVKGARVRDAGFDDDEGLVQQMKYEVIGWCPVVRKLLSLVESATYEPVLDYNLLEQWVSRSGRVSVLGDAAHPLIPLMYHHLSTTISDALTLGALFHKALLRPSYLDESHLPCSVPRLLGAFESIRRPICLRTQLMLRHGHDLLCLQDGEAQKTRDRTLRESGLFGEDEKRREWLQDPLEGVDKWWESEDQRVLEAEEAESI